VIALVRGMSSEGVLWAVTHDKSGAAIPNVGNAPAPARSEQRVVTSLAGVDPRQFYTGELAWN
jgi:hypothetical protein